MPAPLLDAAGREQVHATAVALGSLEAAAQAHGIEPGTVRQWAKRYSWLVGIGADHRRQQRRERDLATAAEHGRTVTAQVVSRPVTVTRSTADTLDESIQQHGRQTRAMLAQALVHAAGQARKTKHPLDKSRQIKDIAGAAAIVHPTQFGGQQAGSTTVQLGILLELSDGGSVEVS